jgi:LacI family transcriptional regulator
MAKVTIKDVARKADVSISTVSYALNGKGNISREVRQKVFYVARALGYKKNIYAEAMVKKKSRNIAILIHEDYAKAYEWNLIRNIFIQLESVVTSASYFPVFLTASYEKKTTEIFEKTISSGIGSIFSIHYGNEQLFNLLEDYSIPVVVINNADYQNKFFTVCSDDYQGAYQGACYLLELGHREIAYCDYHRPDFKNCFADRFIGFNKALTEHNVPFNNKNRITVNIQDSEELREKIKGIMFSDRRPTALFIHDDYMAAKIIVILNSFNIKIPQDVSIIAPGDTLDYNQEYIPRITTMQIDTALLGRIAGNLMIEILDEKIKTHQSLKIRQQLVERGSCRRLA